MLTNMYHPIICGALLAALAGKAVARNQLELQEKPYVRFMLSKPVASDRPEAIYIDLKDWYGGSDAQNFDNLLTFDVLLVLQLRQLLVSSAMYNGTKITSETRLAGARHSFFGDW